MRPDSTSSIFRELEHGSPPLEQLANLLRHHDEAVVHAAVMHLDRRLREGEHVNEWHRMLPGTLGGMPPESQLVLAALAVDGFFPGAPDPTESAPPFVRLGWLRAALLDRPDTLATFERKAICWEAVAGLPCERVIATGLLDRIIESSDSNVRRAALAYLREGLARGLLTRTRTQEGAAKLAEDPLVPLAIEALQFLGEPWTFALPLPRLGARPSDVEVQRGLVKLYCARREVHHLRRILAGNNDSTVLACDLIAALGECGDAGDVPSILSHLQREPSIFGPPGLNALVMLKRRGVSLGTEEVGTLLDLFMDNHGWDAAATAEVVSSRADVVVEAIDALLASRPRWSPVVSLLEALGTRRTVQRLKLMVTSEKERAGWWYAIRALGRLGVADAEEAILARLDDDPDSCLDALRYVGGEHTVRVLSERVAREGAAPVWLAAAARLLFQLDPSVPLFELLSRRGLLTNESFDSLPAYGSLPQSGAMREMVTQLGHPTRILAIRALGRTGGPLAVGVLGEVVADPDDEVRDEAIRALRALGPRLKEQGAVRPACLGSSTDPSGSLVADAILCRLRDRPLEPDVLARLLDALIGLGHPQLVSIVRPQLRHKAPEVRKRVLACLGAAGPAAAAWILPWLSDEDVTVARQALHSLAKIGGRGLAEPVAAWLNARNMNMKKVAAETLAAVGDRSVVPKLLHWLATHDNPGFRQLLVAALRAILGTWFVAAVIDRLSAADSSRSRKLLIDALSGELSASDVAALVGLHGTNKVDGNQHWTTLLLSSVYAGECRLTSGTVTDLDSELVRRGLGDRIPKEEERIESELAWRTPALRAGARLRQALRRSPGDASRTAEVLELLSKANVRGQMIVPALTSSDVHALLDVYPDLSVEAQAGMQQLLASLTLDPVARLRTARLLREPAPDKVPSALMRSSMTTVSSALALQLTAWPDREVQVAAERALLLGDRIEVGAWPQRDAVALLSRLVNERSFELGFEWSRQNGQLPELVRVIHRTHGASVALAQAQRWVDARPELLRVILPELLRLGPAADEVLERFARSTGIELQLRELVIGELGRRSSSGSARALLRELLGDEHADLRAHAARELLKYADQGDREQVLAAWLKGSFREQFSIQLNHADLPVVESALESTQGPARLRLVRLVEHLDDPRQVPLLVDLWKTGDREVREKCRDALRAIDAQRVLPFLQSDLDDGVSASILEVVGPLRSIPEQLVGKCSVATDKATWVRFFERVTGDGVLHAPGLFDVLSLLLREQQGGPAAIRLFVRLDEWSQANKVQELAAAMEPALAGSNRNELLGYIVEATAQLGAAHRARVLASVGRPTDHAIVMALLDVVLASPFVREALSPAMAAAVERELATALDGEPERARRILSHRAGHAVTETERTALVGTLERSLRHPSPRVRLHAHRLLRTHADRPTYLAATRLLLDDRDSTTVRSAIRVLAFGHAIEAVPEMCDLLFHSHAAVRRAARDGLVVLGEDAVSTLTRAIGRARPDQRQALTEVLDEVRQGRGEGEAERGDEGEYVRSWRRS